MNRYMLRAMEVAKKSNCKKRHGCVIVYRGQVVAEATNKSVSAMDNGWRKSHVHAEVAALMSAKNKTSGATLYVARILRDGTPAMSKPCKKCESFIEKCGIGTVVWT